MSVKQSFIKLFVIFVYLVLAVSGSSLVFGQTETPTPTIAPSATPAPTSAPDNSQQKDELRKRIEELQGKITELQGQAKTLSSQIKIVDNQVRLTELRITDTKEKIKNLQGDIEITKKKISGLEVNIDKTTKALMGRIVGVYRVGSVDPWQMLLSSNSLDNFFTRLRYLKIVQMFDKKNVFAAEQAKVNYENQQSILVDKQNEEKALSSQLNEYNEQLNSDKAKKKLLLEETKGSESNYQRLLAQARAEYSAIQGIVAGNGAETEVGPVTEGERIASIIGGASCNSSGGHLHFIVRKNGSTENPFNYLSSAENENCSGSSCGSGDGDAFNPSGGWSWPINPKITMSQGYGQTWAVRNTWVGQVYSFHNGLDINGSSYTVKAVKSGILYRGSYAGGGGCRLPYVRVKHNDDGIDTLYLHVDY